jgi:membrane protein required for beta-lactamase induction
VFDGLRLLLLLLLRLLFGLWHQHLHLFVLLVGCRCVGRSSPTEKSNRP